ncbi:uncharacterized protein JCM6883_005189 [Sporobolomyces salmoneus]|uniref:uncharacterized protein n=1 Tax=Sporobolomyces salmoneus TaxID=183962 RepID=UPI00318256CA
MSLKLKLQTWSEALMAFDQNDYDKALSLFQSMNESGSKVYFNQGMIHATRGNHKLAIEAFEKAIELDNYLAVAYFQVGVSRFLLRKYDEARRDFDDAYLYMRSNKIIDYEQLGLQFQLYSCEVLFNRGLCLVYMGHLGAGLKDWSMAIKEKYTQEHDVIDEAYLDKGEGYTVFSVSVGTVFRPSTSKLANLESRDFLGNSKVVAAANPFDLHLDFEKTSSPSIHAPQSTNSGTNLVRSRSVVDRLGTSIDGVARPLRRRPTMEERKITEKRLRRSQTMPPVRERKPLVPNDSRLRHTFDKSHGNAPAVQHSSVSVNNASPTLEDREGEALVAENISRQLEAGLTTRVPSRPSNPPSFSLSSSRSRPAPLEIPAHRETSISSPPSTSIPQQNPPPLRSASLPPPNFVSQPLSPLRPSRTEASTPRPRVRPPIHDSSIPTGASQHSPPTRQDSCASLSSCASLDSNSLDSTCRLCLSLVGEDGPPSTCSSENSIPGSVLFSYLQDVEDASPFDVLSPQKGSYSQKGKAENKSKIRLLYREQARAMMLSDNIDLSTLVRRIQTKLGVTNDLALSYRDTDDRLVAIVDEEDWQSALDTVSSGADSLEIIVD